MNWRHSYFCENTDERSERKDYLLDCVFIVNILRNFFQLLFSDLNQYFFSRNPCFHHNDGHLFDEEVVIVATSPSRADVERQVVIEVISFDVGLSELIQAPDNPFIVYFDEVDQKLLGQGQVFH